LPPLLAPERPIVWGIPIAGERRILGSSVSLPLWPRAGISERHLNQPQSLTRLAVERERVACHDCVYAVARSRRGGSLEAVGDLILVVGLEGVTKQESHTAVRTVEDCVASGTHLSSLPLDLIRPRTKRVQPVSRGQLQA